ncbi:unnamed protein product [Mycena citricolor]|uniref:Endo-beta-1,6-galactanase-like domain-containing protein n=1 Tax=Mycena citricolor TaxID=2018698 RepID=A0AAD2K083_9AGAR|nr:unnamed protein product [Mycena citricolor]
MLSKAFVLASLLVSARSATVSSTPAQTFLGVGGSGAWWPHDLYQFPPAARTNLSNLLFSPSGLGLSSYRYNVGGGGVGVGNPGRAPETTYVSPGVYNFSADPQGVLFMQDAASFGVPITFFVNSAPSPFTTNGASCGGWFVNGTGIEYGKYLADVIAYWHGQGVLVKYISPMNEPDNSFGDPGSCGQEGMEVDANQRAEVVNGLWAGLQSVGLEKTVGILADESSSLSRAMNEYPIWLPEVVDKATLVHHTYDFPSDASYSKLVADVAALAPGKKSWMSEVCCSLGLSNGTGKGWSGGYDPTIQNALMFSGMVFQSFVFAGEPHYDFWTLVSGGMGCQPLNNATCVNTPNPDGWTDGIIYYDADFASNGNYDLYLSKHYWTYKHFGNFVKPGTVRHPLVGPDVQEYMMAVASETTYSLLLMNPNSTDSTLDVTFHGHVCPLSAVRTSATEDFAAIAPGAKSSPSVYTLPLKAESLTTYVFKRGHC